MLSVILSKLFQLVLTSCHVPNGFKHSYIVPIPKSKDCRTKAMLCDDFRGIAISPVISKIFEHCLLKQLQLCVASNDNQFGFKKGLGCSHAIYTLRSIVNKIPPSSTYMITIHQRYRQTDRRTDTDRRHTMAIPLHCYSMER